MIDIMMLSCNRKRITELSVRELQARTTTPHRLIVMDNGSEDGTAEMLKDLFTEGLISKLVLLEENTGVHVGFNALLDLVESEPYYICTDADLIPAVPTGGQDWLEKLISLKKANPDYGAIACRPHILIGEPPDRFDNCGEIREMSHVGAHLRIMDVAAVRKAGGWKKEKAPSRNNEDWHIAAALKRIGLKVGYSRDIRAIHFFGDPDKGEDPWGYPIGVEHGHVERWPPVHHFSWKRQGISFLTCKKEVVKEDEEIISERLRALGYE